MELKRKVVRYWLMRIANNNQPQEWDWLKEKFHGQVFMNALQFSDFPKRWDVDSVDVYKLVVTLKK